MQPKEVLKEIYQMVSGDRGITIEKTQEEEAIILGILVDETQGLIESECPYLFDDNGNLK